MLYFRSARPADHPVGTMITFVDFVLLVLLLIGTPVAALVCVVWHCAWRSSQIPPVAELMSDHRDGPDEHDPDYEPAGPTPLAPAAAPETDPAPTPAGPATLRPTHSTPALPALRPSGRYAPVLPDSPEADAEWGGSFTHSPIIQ